MYMSGLGSHEAYLSPGKNGNHPDISDNIYTPLTYVQP